MKKQVKNSAWLKSKINVKIFEKLTSPLVVYFLGFFWADGHIHKDKKRGYTNTSIHITKKDALQLFPFFQKLGNWNIIDKIKHNNSKNFSSRLYSADIEFYNF